MSFLTHILSRLVPSALAQGAPVTVWCSSNLPGCGESGEVVGKALVAILGIVVTAAASLSMVFFVWGAVQMVMPWNPDGGEEAGKKTIKNSLLGLGITLVSGYIVEFASSAVGDVGGNSNPFVALMQGVIRILLLIFNPLLAIAILYAGYLMVMDQANSGSFSKGITVLKYAIIAGLLVNLSKPIVEIFISFLAP